jgi:putative methyltransferase (TIGR04325 family)
MGEAIFLGKFESYLECHQKCSAKNEESGSTQFPKDIWRQRQLQEFDKQRTGQYNRSQTISNFLKIDTFYNILDFGGGSGWLFDRIQSVYAGRFQYYLLETDESLEVFEDINNSRAALVNFTATNLDQFSNSNLSVGENILYINSVLQYIEDPIKQIEKLLNVYPANTIIFDDLVNFESDDFWSCQRYYDHLVPYHFLNLFDFIDSVSRLGFHLIRKVDYEPVFSTGWDCRVDNFGESIFPDRPKSLAFAHESVNNLKQGK